MDEQIRRIRVKPYPIDVTVQVASGVKPVSILKLTLKGFIADVKAALFIIGEDGVLQGALPADLGPLHGTVRVIKTYDQIKAADQSRQRLVEFHFIKAHEEMLDHIHLFLQKIRQKG